jgi:hypothetical protein
MEMKKTVFSPVDGKDRVSYLIFVLKSLIISNEDGRTAS